MTYSVVAYCPRTGQHGIGIATYSPNVGARCPIVVPGRGAASIQAVASPDMLRHAGRLLDECLSAEAIIASLRAADPYPEFRQVCVVDAYGRAHAATNSRNAAWAGHRVGNGFVCAGNVLVGPAVVDAMADAFTADPRLDLAERLVRAIEAGRDAGGQPEGQNSAALMVCGKERFPLVDLRVDLHDEPESELRRLWDWYAPMVPFYISRSTKPDLASRWWEWRRANVAGWVPRHLRK